LIFLFALTPVLCAQERTAPETVASLNAVAIEERILIDGKLTEPAWQAATPFSDFHQRDPHEGDPSSEITRIRFLYDDRALYVGVELFDADSSHIVARLSRRDAYPDSDYFTLYLDPYHDHLTGAMFRVSAAGVQQDSAISNDTNQDSSWDAVWQSAVTQNNDGWFLEMRIPFSQLRFSSSTGFAWGVNAERYIHRKAESSWLQLVPKSETGLASRMAHLYGMKTIVSRRNLEVRPYFRTSAELAPAVAGNPFDDGSRVFRGGGMDLKYGISSNVILDATINPDFGQVESDPAVVNLSASETYFDEKRPFFLEGFQLFNNFGRGGGGGNNVAFPTFFYSRRIGRAPQGPASGTYVSRPSAATILGAAKITGKTASGWSFGALNAVTQMEQATVIDSAGTQSRIPIEPLTNHWIARTLREYSGRGGFGMLITGTERKLTTKDLQNLMPKQAHVAGADGYYFLDNNSNWFINGRFAESIVSGSAAAMDRVQRASQRYFQRPDNTYAHYNPKATSLSGWHGGTLLRNRQGGVLVQASLDATSPGFETNDAGFQTLADQWGFTSQVVWRQNHTDRFTRYREIFISRNEAWNFHRDRRFANVRIGGSLSFLNYWQVYGNITYNQRANDDHFTRGGPITPTPGSYGTYFGFNSDSRKRFNLGGEIGYDENERGGWGIFSNLWINFKPASSLTVSVEPNFRRSRSFAQYVATIDDATATRTYEKRYIFADFDQSGAGMTNRVNWSITPTLSLQVYSQILFSAGDYWDIKELDRPKALDFLRYGRESGTMTSSGTPYTIDPDGAGAAPDFLLRNPDFNFKAWQVNSVFRWEYKPGSTLYAIWTHDQSDSQYPGTLSPRRDVRALLGAPGRNVFMVKISYWLNR
jgi:hypothetical protein